MFKILKNLFGKKVRNIEQWELDLLKNTLQKLPDKYHSFICQINDGLFRKALIGYSSIPNWIVLLFNDKVIDKYHDGRLRGYNLKGMRVFDKLSGRYLNYVIGCSSGVIIGYSITGAKKFDIDVTNIDVTAFKEEFFENNVFNSIEKMFTPAEKKFINPDLIYEVELDNKVYYHLFDLKNGDGDFVGMDKNKCIYLITQDPYNIKPLNITLEEVYSQKW